MAGGSMGGALDWRQDLHKVDYDPTITLGTDPSTILGKPVDTLTQVLQQLPKVAINAITTLLTSPEMLADLLKAFPNTGLEALNDWAEGIPGIEQLVQAFTGVAGGLTDLSNYMANWESMFGGLDFTDPDFDPQQAVRTFIQLMLLPTNLFAQAVQALGFPDLIPISAIADFIQNLLPNPTYEGADSLDGLDVWDWVGNIRHSLTGGSAHTVGDGELKELRSDPPTLVRPGQTLDLGHWVRWAGINTGAGDAFRLLVEGYDNDEAAGAPVTTVVVDKITNPPATSNNPVEDNFEELAGTWTVPPGPVKSTRMVLQQMPTVTQGESWWDDANMAKTQLLKQDWISGLATRLQGLNPLNGLFDAAKLSNQGAITLPDGLAQVPELQNIVDAATNALSGASQTGAEIVGAGVTAAKATMENLFEMLSATTRKVQALEAEQTASTVGGRRHNINFGDYPNGAFPASLFNLTYSGGGTGVLAIDGGKAVWNVGNSGYRRAFMQYPEPTLTSYQVVRGTMGSPPEQGTNVRIWSLGRMNAAGTDYVFARGYCTGFLSYKGDIGCVRNGVEHIWAQGIGLTWSLDLRVIMGVGLNARRHMVLSGDTIVWDGVEPADPTKQSYVDADHLYWGALSETNGGKVPGNVAGASTVDNAPPAVIGTTFRASRRVGADVTIGTGGVRVPNGFYDTVDYISPDLVYNPNQNCRVTASKQGTYLAQYRTLHGQYAAGAFGHGLLFRNGAKYERSSWAGNQLNLGFSVNTTLEDATYASFIVPLNPGDYIEPGYDFTASMGNTGDTAALTDGSQTWFAVTRVGIA